MPNIEPRLTRLFCRAVTSRKRQALAQIFVGCVSLMLIGAACADSDVALSAASPRIMPMAQGEEGEFVVRVTNNGPDPITSVTIATPVASIFSDWYPFTMPVQTGCDGLFPGFPFHPSGFIQGYYFTVGPLSAGQHQDCRFTVRRALTTTSDGGCGWQTSGENDSVPGNDAIGFVFGSLTDVGIRVDTVGFSIGADGFANGIVRLTAQNHGPTSVREFQVGACTDNFFPEFSIDGNFAEGCGTAKYGPICFDNGFGFLRPALAAGQSHSCLIRLRSRARYTQPLSFPLDLQTYSLVRQDFGALADINPNNDYAEMQLGPVPEVSVDAISSFGQWILILLLAVGAMRMLQTKERRT